MANIVIPLQIKKGAVLLVDDVKKSIDRHISLLMQTSYYSWAADPYYGFVLRNLRFEIFNEKEGTIYDSVSKSTDQQFSLSIYKMKVTGTSNNLSTFAAELKSSIEHYEPRLQNVATAMTYVREERKIYVSVKGFLPELEEDYLFETIIKIWN